MKKTNTGCVYVLFAVILAFSTVAADAQTPRKTAGKSAATSKTTFTVAPSGADRYGTIVDGKYLNFHFGFELVLPVDWNQLNKNELEAAREMGSEGLKTTNEAYNKRIDAATNSELVVLAMGRKPFGSIENSAMGVGIAKQPSVLVTPKMIAEASKSLLLKNPANQLTKDIKLESIGGKTFAVFDMSMGLYGQTVPIRFYATMVGQNSLTITFAYYESESLELMEASLRTIKFTNR